MEILCLDLEGVLVPEMWPKVARDSGVEELMLTPADQPDFGRLMDRRLEAMTRHQLKLSSIQESVAELDPLPGAVEFMSWASSNFQVVILSDTFYEIAMPLVRKIGNPFLLCHTLEVHDDQVRRFHLRQPNPKTAAVRNLQRMNKRILAVGDSYNDLAMLHAADKAYFLNAPAKITKQYELFPNLTSFEELTKELSYELENA
ncbi:MAG: bifunctional phosphoserine phosphatase/homoserine phosphotransferase ThrH [Pseudomonadales bacterium]|nr:bifunctional phosphoserine phosphatase/homoserine phosphotransferase ThrH [Pseudomonadales bacterium]